MFTLSKSLEIFTVWICLFFVTVKGALTTIKVTANTQHAFITSPNYPQPYAGSYSVEWNILANDSISNAIIHLKVLDSVLAMTFTCYEDIVEVMDGPSSMYSVIKDWCGESYPSAVIKASGDSATVSFSTNKGDNNYKGFNIEYWAEVDGSKGFGPVKMTSAHWALAVLSAIIYGTLFGGCIFLIAVKTNACQYDKNIHESRVIHEEHLIEDLPKHKVEDDKAVKKEIKRQKKKKQSNSKLPPISKTLRPTLNLKQWKNMLASK